QSLANRLIVLGYYFSSHREARRSGALPLPLFEGEAAKQLGERLTHASGYGANIAPLQQAARSSGFFNPFMGSDIDADGVIRALPLLAGYGGGVYESMAVAVLREYLGDATLEVSEADDTLLLEGLRGRVR